MPKQKKTVIKPEVELEEEEVEEEKVEEEKEEEEKVEEVEEEKTEAVTIQPEEEPRLGTIGPHKISILNLRKVSINGQEYNELWLADGTIVVLNDDDLAKQKNL